MISQIQLSIPTGITKHDSNLCPRAFLCSVTYYISLNRNKGRCEVTRFLSAL